MDLVRFSPDLTAGPTGADAAEVSFHYNKIALAYPATYDGGPKPPPY